MKICEMMGMEVRGMQPSCLIDAPDRTRFDRLLALVMTEPAVVELTLAAPNRAGSYGAHMLMMPLRSDFGDINRVIGCTSGEGELFAPPLAFRIEDVAVSPVQTGPAPAAEPPGRGAMPGFAEPAPAFAAAPGLTGAPKLRSIEGNPNAPSTPRPPLRLRVIDGK